MRSSAIDPGVRVAIVGGGFAGIAMAIAMRRAGHTRDMVIIEAAEEFGGTWRDNVYPGAACDVPSHLYSLRGERHDWPAIYSHQPAIHDYILELVRRHDLRRHARLGTAVRSQTWDEARACWTLALDDGDTVEAEAVVNGLGPLRRPSLPNVPGRASFSGPSFHSARWDPHVDLRDKRVAVVGTGASAVQIIPEIAEEVAHLHVVQRTPSWVLPRVEYTFSPRQRAVLRAVPAAQWVLRHGANWILEHVLWPALALDEAAQQRSRKIGLWNIRAGIDDPALRAAVTPTLAPGCKRLMFSNTYYPTLARDDVTLHPTAVTEVTPEGLCLADGREVAVDVIVYATGFDPHHFWQPMTIRGRGATIDERWSRAAAAYLGTSTPDFPNMFFLLGPNTGTGHNSVLLMMEAQVDYVMQALDHLRSGAADWLAPTHGAARAFAEELTQRHADLVWASGCSAWYRNDAGINDTLYPGRVKDFRRRLRRFDVEHYDFGSTAAGAAPRMRTSAPAASS